MSRTSTGIAFGLVLLGSLTGSLARPALADTINVLVNASSFSPADLTINPGDTVRWVRVTGNHTVTSGTDCSPNGMFDGSIGLPNPAFEFTFPNLGNYPYYCTFHCLVGMTGIIRVVDPAAAPAADQNAALNLATWPNPMQTSTEVRLRLANAGAASLGVFDAAGREIASLHAGSLASGEHRFVWNGKTDSGETAPSGMYFVRASTTSGTATTTLLRLK